MSVVIANSWSRALKTEGLDWEAVEAACERAGPAYASRLDEFTRAYLDAILDRLRPEARDALVLTQGTISDDQRQALREACWQAIDSYEPLGPHDMRTRIAVGLLDPSGTEIIEHLHWTEFCVERADPELKPHFDALVREYFLPKITGADPDT